MWYFERGHFPSNVQVSFAEGKSELVITNVQPDNAGGYKCEYEDSYIQYAMFDLGELEIKSENEQEYKMEKNIIHSVNISS